MHSPIIKTHRVFFTVFFNISLILLFIKTFILSRVEIVVKLYPVNIIKNSEIGIKTDNGIFLDPSNETAQQLISDGVKEIAENYDVDGIQFDDYFYPTEDESFDKKQYEAY